MSRKLGILVIQALIIAVFLARTGYAQDGYRFVDLGSVPAETGSVGFGVNDQGQVAGQAYWSAGPSSQRITAFTWENGSKTLLPTPAGDVSIARGINNGGRIVGGTGGMAAYWEDDSLVLIGPPEQGPLHSSAWDINDNNVMVGESWNKAFYWDGSMHELDEIAGERVTAYGINDLGHIIGQSTTNIPSDYFSWFLHDGTVEKLGNLPLDPPLIPFSAAYDINDLDQIVGLSGGIGGSGPRAVLWENGTIRELGGAETSDETCAWGINNKGQAVGHVIGNGGYGGYYACLWENGTLIDLNTYLPDEYSEWSLMIAYDISENGYITGMAHGDDGRNHAFLLEPEMSPVVPEPATMALMGMGLFGLMARIRKTRKA